MKYGLLAMLLARDAKFSDKFYHNWLLSRVQVITTPENDHLSLAVAAALEEKFGGWISPSKLNVLH